MTLDICSDTSMVEYIPIIYSRYIYFYGIWVFVLRVIYWEYIPIIYSSERPFDL